MKKFILLLIIESLLISHAGYSQVETKRNILVITAHPDDFEAGVGGTALLLKDKYNFHILICTGGDRGLGKDPDPKTVAIRKIEAANAAKMVNGELHFMGKVDQEACADRKGIDQIVALLKELDPAIIFTMWGIEVPDHAAVSNMARMALYETGMIHDREVYFFEAGRGGQTNQFEPDFYVNITEVKQKKDSLLACHVCQNKDNKLVGHHEEQARFHGWVARCEYAEPFKTYYPLINSRWDKDPQYTLLGIETKGLLKPYDNNREVLIISTHPDDWEIAMGGTAALMKDKYNIHVLILTRGEAAMGKDKTDECAKLRREQAEAGCKKINASLHIMNFPDGKLAASKELVDSILFWANKINPGIIFMHWQLDKPDHAAAANASSKALSLNGMIHDHEIYYFGVQQGTLKSFDPELYVNITPVIEQKKELITLHDLPTHKKGELMYGSLEMNKFFGSLNGCEYAEGFRTQNPLINHRWNKKTRFSLLNL